MKVKLTSRMILTASRVFPSFRAHIASRRLTYTRILVSRPAFYNHITVCILLLFYAQGISNTEDEEKLVIIIIIKQI